MTIESAALFDVSDRGKVELTGPDAPKFLHNLCTNDILTLPLGAGGEFFLATATAKAVAHGVVYHLLLDGRHALWLDFVPGLNEKVVKHLDRYLISEQVEFADRTGAFAQFHLAGPKATAVLAKAVGDDVPPLEALQHMERPVGETACHARRTDPLGVTGYDVMCLVGRADAVRAALVNAGATPAGPEVYETMRIEAGTPVYGKDIDDNRFVAEVGRTGAISFNKGCYLGQEPIVMARDRAGHVNRLLRGVKLPGGTVPAPGDALFRDGQEVGLVTSATHSARLGMPVALAYLRWKHQEPGTPVEVGAARQPGEVSALPM